MCLLHDSSPEKLTVWEGRSYMDTSNYNARNMGHQVLLELRGENLCGELGWTGPPRKGEGEVFLAGGGLG